MKRRFYRELWALRFKRMLKLEEKSAVDYQVLIDECTKRFKDHSIVTHLTQLVADEKRHALLVRELIEILDSQPK